MSQKVRKIESDGTVLGMYIPATVRPATTQFFTDSDLPLQTGVFAHDGNFEEPSHTHAEVVRTVERTHQVVHLTEGTLIVEFSLEDGTHVATQEVTAGDTILLADGAHAVSALEPVRGVTVKQGPYLGEENDKIWLREGDG
jgi:hypothetical protein